MKHIAKKIISLILFPFNHLFYTLYIFLFGVKADRSKQYYISVCSIFKNESIYLREWIEYNLVVGVEHFYLYNNFSDDDYHSVLKPYIDNGIVTLTDWPVEQGQISAYKDCIKRFAPESAWISFLDIDEFIVPKQHNDLHSFLHEYQKYPSIHIPWKMFGTSGKLDACKDKLVCEQYIVCWEGVYEHKCIVNTSYGISNLNHHQISSTDSKVNIPGVDQNKIFNMLGLYAKDSAKKIQINHYWSKSYDEYLYKSGKGDVYHKISTYNQERFYFSEHKNTSVDYSIYKYLIKLKLAIKGLDSDA
ncbi:glycosyltransferase family 92 protein [Shewanella sp. ULN5]|uniref:glycosyltransferase family 92 protein n=1 Tax=Shewanella sp. ULN5 TaxID=2994678 RepID=UPI00273F4DF7|nr:glycosyltransferase family 92 protein [Shewanella sp. ULN5]MDP5145074.1 glycosyltransferase family 92 protein [Shewanella sp. ULN5]